MSRYIKGLGIGILPNTGFDFAACTRALSTCLQAKFFAEWQSSTRDPAKKLIVFRGSSSFLVDWTHLIKTTGEVVSGQLCCTHTIHQEVLQVGEKLKLNMQYSLCSRSFWHNAWYIWIVQLLISEHEQALMFFHLLQCWISWMWDPWQKFSVQLNGEEVRKYSAGDCM